jgi:hypothetical protein
MTAIGPDTCRRCGRGVLLLPLSGGTLEAFDLREFPIDDVDEGDRFVVRAHRGAAEPLKGDEPITSCLRRHGCKVDQPNIGTMIPTESPQLHRTPAAATRSDLQGLRQLRTNAELLRLQTLGRLRTHPGSRHYSPVTIPAALTGLSRLDEHHCLLCRQKLDEHDQLAVAAVEGTTIELFVCLPECRRAASRQPPTGS